MASLLVQKGPNPGASLPLDGDKIVIGRNADCGIVLALPAVSREHAVIRRTQGRYFIEDLKSRNGTRVNNQEIAARTPLQNNDRIKICDNEFIFLEVTRPPLPENMRRPAEPEVEEEQSSSTVEATISQSGRQILEAQPTEKLAFLLSITSELTQTFNLKELLPKVAESLFDVFKQADRCFIIFADEGSGDRKLIPEVIKTRLQSEEGSARFSRTIVNRCLNTGQAFLIEDASTGKGGFDLSQSIADCRIRSVMCVPLTMRSTDKAFGVIQLDTQARHKKFTQEDLKLLHAVAGQASVALENARLHQTIVSRAGLERDLALANRVQESFLPKRPPEVAGYEFFAFYKSAQEVGGDYYDFIPLPGGRYGVMVGDVAGKGVPAALLMAKISSDARYLMLTRPDPADAVSHLNEVMQEAGLLDRFVTLMACLLDPAADTVTFVNAGHLPPLIYRQASKTIEEATSRELAGFPLGIADGTRYESATVALAPGDVVVVFTDGVLDAKNRAGQDFKMEGVIDVLQAGDSFTPRDLGDRLVNAIKQHSQGAKQVDDITVVCFGRTTLKEG